MKVAVWDTYVTRDNRKVMNFDIIVPAIEQREEIIYGYGRQYLQTKSMPDNELSSRHCSFCHIEKATDVILESIREKGYHIVEIKNCQ